MTAILNILVFAFNFALAMTTPVHSLVWVHAVAAAACGANLASMFIRSIMA